MKINFKIRKTTSTEIKEVQDILFKLGFIWRGDTRKKNYYHDFNFLYFYCQKNPAGNPVGQITWGISQDYFNEHPNKEITLQELQSENIQDMIKKALLVGSLN